MTCLIPEEIKVLQATAKKQESSRSTIDQPVALKKRA